MASTIGGINVTFYCHQQNGHKEPLLCFHLGAFTEEKERRGVRSDKFVYTTSGSELEFQNWGPNQPNNDAIHNCVMLYKGQWYDNHCPRKTSFICEFV